MIGICMDVLLNHFLCKSGLFKHHCMVRCKADDHGSGHICIVGTKGGAAGSDDIQQIISIQAEKINDVMDGLCLQHINRGGILIVVVLIDHVPLRHIRLFRKAVSKFGLGSNTVQIAHPGN